MTLDDRVGALEQRVADNHAALQSRMEAIRTELREKFNLLLRTWEAQERGRKEWPLRITGAVTDVGESTGKRR